MAGLKASRPFFQPWQTQADAVGQLVGSGLSHYVENWSHSSCWKGAKLVIKNLVNLVTETNAFLTL